MLEAKEVFGGFYQINPMRTQRRDNYKKARAIPRVGSAYLRGRKSDNFLSTGKVDFFDLVVCVLTTWILDDDGFAS